MAVKTIGGKLTDKNALVAVAVCFTTVAVIISL